MYINIRYYGRLCNAFTEDKTSRHNALRDVCSNPYHNIAQGQFIGVVGIEIDYSAMAKEAVWLPLSNGMYLNIAVPIDETQGEWRGLIINILICSTLALIAAGIFLLFFLGLITKPLVQLTEAAEQVDKGNFDVDLSYDKDDEIGRLTKSFKKLSGNMKAHINALNEQAFT